TNGERMLRAIVVFLAGAGVAAVATFVIFDRGPALATDNLEAPAAGDADSSWSAPTTANAAAATLSERVAAARALRAARYCEPALRAAAAEHAAYARDAELGALIERCAELDAARAAALVADLGLERRFLVAAFRAWAARDAERALAALGALDNVADRRLGAAGLLEVLGDDDATIRRIAAAVPGADETSLRLEALFARASRAAPAA